MSETHTRPSCPDAATLRALLDGQLPTDQLAVAQAHAEGCPHCEGALRQMTAGGESWIGLAEKLKGQADSDPKVTAAVERLKGDDDSPVDREPSVNPQQVLDFLSPSDDPKSLGRLGQHEVLEIVGWGGMGVVLKAYDPGLHRVVAVKVLSSHLAHHAVARKRFIREAQAAAAVCHDNVVTIHGIEDGGSLGEPGGVSPRTSDAATDRSMVRGLTPSGSPLSQALPKIVMQFVAGGSLQERIDAEGPLELKEVLRIAMQTAAGLAAAHAQGVVHRDVKPANILLENGVQRVKLTDFGLARVMDDASLTLSGVIAGTPQYMAPEQAWGRDVDARADLFSLGAVMYAMCSGHSPFRARTTMAVLKRVCDDSPRPLRAINPDVPDWLVAIIEKLLAKNADERFQTATEVSELLGKWLAHVQQPTVVAAPEFSARRGSPDPAALPDRRSPEFSRDVEHKGDLRSKPSAGSGDPRTTSTPARGQLPARFVVWPLIVMWVLLGVMFAVVMADSGMRNIEGFLGFSAIQLIATFVLASVFRSAWNSSSWLVWIGSLLFLPFVASLFAWGASYRDAAALTQWLNALQALSAMAYWLGLLFVRPLFVRESDARRAAPVFQWGRVLALSVLLLVPVSLWVVMQMRMSEVSRQRAYYEATEAARITMPADAAVAPQPRDPRRTQIDERGFPKPVLLSSDGSPESPFDTSLPEPIAGRMPPSSTGGSAAMAAAPDSLKPLHGRWVVLTLQGDEPPFASAAAGGPGMMSAPGYPTPSGNAAAVTPSTSDQLRSLEFRDGLAIFDDSEENRFSAEVHKDRELLLQYPTTGEGVRHGVFTIADDRLVICWTSRHQPLPRGFQPKPHEQLVVCRREWSRPRQKDGEGSDAAVKFDEHSKLPKAEMPFSSREAAELQAAWAEKSKSPVEVTNSIGLKLRVIPPGSFGDPRNVAAFGQSVGGMSAGFGVSGSMMGGGDGSMGSGAGMMMAGGQRSGERGYAAINGPILVGAHEVTVAQFRQFVEDSKYVSEAERSETSQPAKPHSWQKPEIEQDSDQHPVVNVTFEDALAFCHWLSLKEKKPYRLLTRREWEFCARAGSWLPATLGPGKLSYRSQFFTTTAPVGSYSANSFGLHDFIGNVAEWAWHNDITSENDSRRSPPNSGIWTGDPTVFCGGDFRQHITRSQPSEWLHPAATTTHPTIGFRVACDLTPASAVSLPKRWPTNQLLVSQEFVRIRTRANADSKNDESAASPDGRLINAVWLEMLVRAEQMPYAVEWLDFEIERRATPEGEDIDQFLGRRIAEAGAEEGWRPLDLAPTLRLLEQTEFLPDLATTFLNPVLTMPIPKEVSGQWASPDNRGGLPTDFERLMRAIQKPQLFRILDLDAPHGKHRYRVRLKYRVPGLAPEIVRTTSWFVSLTEAEIDLDYPGKSKPPENIPVIELKPQPPVDPNAPPLRGKKFPPAKSPTAP